ncbi:M50 family metallopeptidase [Patescibacteria group bacterium]|nr:M50 family metallopeptidase [Patescibacteria group bacterium]
MINSIPFGGYVKLFGEDGSNANDPRSFAAKSWWQRALIISAGIVMNLILGGICLGITFMIGLPIMDANYQATYPYASVTPQVVAYEILEDSPAQDILQPNDEIIQLNGIEIHNITDFKAAISKTNSEVLDLTIIRNQETLNLQTKANYSQEEEIYQIGVIIVEQQIVQYPWYLAIPMGFVEMMRLLGIMIVALFTIVKDLVISQQAPTQIAGPVGIYQITAAASQMGLVYILHLTAILNINLAIINFLPIPALDGGRVIFVVMEKLRGKKISANIENLVHTVGFLFIIGLIILVTISDINNFF